MRRADALPVYSQDQYWQQTPNVAAGSDVQLPFTLREGLGLLDMTDPLNPAAKATGFYTAVWGINNYGTQYAGKYFAASVQLDSSGVGVGIFSSTELQAPALDYNGIQGSESWLMIAGMKLAAYVRHNADSPVDFELYVYLTFTPATLAPGS